MDLIDLQNALVRTSQGEHPGRDPDLVRVAHGLHLRRSAFVGLKPWEARRLVARARLATTAGRRQILTGESALVALASSGTWNDNPDLWTRVPRRHGRQRPLPAVPVDAHDVAPVVVHRLSGSPPFSELQAAYFMGFLLAPPAVIALDLARREHSLVALHNVSALLRYLCRFSRFDLEDSRRRMERWRESLEHGILALGTVRGARRSAEILAHADAGLESPAESTVYWALCCLLRDTAQIVVQHPVKSGGKQFFIDLALPRYRVAVEASGYGKFGGSANTARSVATEFSSRQQALTDHGWRFVHVFVDQTKDLAGLGAYLRERLRSLGVPVPSIMGSLWENQTEQLFAKDRRF